jgi:hypothetical protein
MVGHRKDMSFGLRGTDEYAERVGANVATLARRGRKGVIDLTSGFHLDQTTVAVREFHRDDSDRRQQTGGIVR